MGFQLSIVLCTWNNSKRLTITLESLVQCQVPHGINWELIIVNNNCTDDTDAVVNHYKDKLPIVYVHEPKQGLSRAKNAGLKVVRGEFIIFTDDDVRVSKNWLRVYWESYCKMPHGYFWGGPVESEFEDPHVPEGLLRLVKDYSIVGFSLPKEGVPDKPEIRFISANWACSKSAMDKLGGFDTALGLNAVSGKVTLGEETDVMNRLVNLGLKMWYLSDAKIRHFVPRSKTSLRHISLRTKALGQAYFQGLIYNPSKPKLLGVPLLVYRLIVVSQLQWFFSLLTGRPDYSKFIGYWHYRGVWDGFYRANQV